MIFFCFRPSQTTLQDQRKWKDPKEYPLGLLEDPTSGKRFVFPFQKEKSQTISSNCTNEQKEECREMIGQIWGSLGLRRPPTRASRKDLANGYIDASSYLTTPLRDGSDAMPAAIYAVQDGVELPEWEDEIKNLGTAIKIASGRLLLKKISDVRVRFIKDNVLPISHVQTGSYRRKGEPEILEDRPLKPSELENEALEGSNVKLPFNCIKFSRIYSKNVCFLLR